MTYLSMMKQVMKLSTQSKKLLTTEKKKRVDSSQMAFILTK